MAHNHLRAHTLHSVTLSYTFTPTPFPPLSVYLSLIVKHPHTNTLSALPQVSENQALGFLFFAGWGNDMVVALTVVAVKQQIHFTAAPFCLFMWGDGVCVVIWRCAITLSLPKRAMNNVLFRLICSLFHFILISFPSD